MEEYILMLPVLSVQQSQSIVVPWPVAQPAVARTAHTLLPDFLPKWRLTVMSFVVVRSLAEMETDRDEFCCCQVFCRDGD